MKGLVSGWDKRDMGNEHYDISYDLSKGVKFVRKYQKLLSKVMAAALLFQSLFIGMGGEGLFSKAQAAAAGEASASAAAAIERPYFPPTDSEVATAVYRADQLLETYTEEQWLNLVPKQSPRTDGFSAPDGSDNDGWVWNPADPDRIMTAKGLVLPSEEYPFQYKPIKVMSGKTVDVAYIEYNGRHWYVQTRIDYAKTNFMMRNLPIIATAYLVTGDEKYARRVAIALDAWATVVPDFFMTAKNNPTLIKRR